MTSTAMQKFLLVISICLIVFGLGLTISGAFSPAWQVVDIREFRAEHQHGLWWDCIRAEKHVVAVGDFYDETPLHCMYKFDQSAELVIENSLNNVDQDGAAGEAEHHRFWPWHKAILFFIIFSQFLAFVSICTGVCAPCFHPTAFAFTISLFIALLCSVIADGVFFFAANRVDIRFVQGMVGTYEQRIGYAFFLHLAGTLCWLFAFLCAMATTYKFFTGNGQRKLFESSNDNYRRPELSHVRVEWQPTPMTTTPGGRHNPSHGSTYSTNLAGYRRQSSLVDVRGGGHFGGRPYASQFDPLIQPSHHKTDHSCGYGGGRDGAGGVMNGGSPYRPTTTTVGKQVGYLRPAIVNSSNGGSSNANSRRGSPMPAARVYRETTA